MASVEEQLAAISKKIDYIQDRMVENENRQQEKADLMKDLELVGNDAFQSAVQQFEELSPYFDLDDLWMLVKKLLRNTRQLCDMFNQLESARDFMDDLRPVFHEAFHRTLKSLDEIEQSGYFQWLRNIPEIQPPEKISLRKVFKQMRDPDVLKGMSMMLEVVKTMPKNGRPHKEVELARAKGY